MAANPPREGALERLQRWELFGGHWRVLSRDGHLLDLGLYTCDGGEMVDRLTADDAPLLQYVGSRRSDEDD